MHSVSSLTKFSIEVHCHRVSALVRGRNTHSRLKNIKVALWQIVRGGAVNKDRVQRLSLFNKFNNLVKVSLFTVSLNLVAPASQINTVSIKNHAVNISNSHNLNVNLLSKKRLLLIMNLVKQSAANCARAKSKHLNRLRSVKEE